MIRDIAALFRRDLATLEREIAAYPDDASLWREVPGQPILGGNLALHLIGNLRHFIGAELGQRGFVRDRPLEFAQRDLSREALIHQVGLAAREVEAALASLEPTRLDEPYPIELAGTHPSIGAALLHLCTHLTFHLGQMDYHRRAATGDNASVAPVSLTHLAQPGPSSL